MPELERIIEEKLINQLVYGESQWTYRDDLKTEEDLWKNFDIQCGGKRDADEVTLTVEFAGYDCGYVADHILPFYYMEATAPAFLGPEYNGPTDLASVQAYIKAQDYKKAQFLIAKSMSVNKAYIMNLLQDKAKLAEIELQVNNLRLMIK